MNKIEHQPEVIQQVERGNQNPAINSRRAMIAAALLAAATVAAGVEGCVLDRTGMHLFEKDGGHAGTGGTGLEGGTGGNVTGGTGGTGNEGGIGGNLIGGGGTGGTGLEGGGGGTGGTGLEGGGGSGGTGGTGLEGGGGAGGNGGTGGSGGGPVNLTIKDQVGKYQVRNEYNNGTSNSTSACNPYTQQYQTVLGALPNDLVIVGEDDQVLRASWPEPVNLNVEISCYDDFNGGSPPNPPCMDTDMAQWSTGLQWVYVGQFNSVTADTGINPPQNFGCAGSQFTWRIKQ